ncbi:MAG: hypothetical protein M3357_09470 [Actinomycetota bacterium]|nr:hypothetical protein [Actinomycetota bacterium]
MAADPSLLGKALGSRLRDLEAAVERFGSYSFAPGEPAPPAALVAGEMAPAAREIVLRALRVAGDPAAYAWLQRLSGGDATLAELADLAGVSRLVAWERINDLVQVGLVARDLDGDRAGLTGAGRVLVDLVEEAAESAAAELPS